MNEAQKAALTLTEVAGSQEASILHAERSTQIGARIRTV